MTNQICVRTEPNWCPPYTCAYGRTPPAGQRRVAGEGRRELRPAQLARLQAEQLRNRRRARDQVRLRAGRRRVYIREKRAGHLRGDVEVRRCTALVSRASCRESRPSRSAVAAARGTRAVRSVWGPGRYSTPLTQALSPPQTGSVCGRVSGDGRTCDHWACTALHTPVTDSIATSTNIVLRARASNPQFLSQTPMALQAASVRCPSAAQHSTLVSTIQTQ